MASDVIKIHLGDQSDAKVLLGSYICTDVPGEFKWQPGALTQAVQLGKWIVIEDINLASMDVISVLLPLLESRKLFIPGRGVEIEAAHGFQIFATETLVGTGKTKTASGASHTGQLVNKFWTKVHLRPGPLHRPLCRSLPLTHTHSPPSLHLPDCASLVVSPV